MRAIGYCRVSTAEQGDSRAGLEAQESVIWAEVKHRGWDLVGIYTDVASGKSLRRRDQLAVVLAALRDHTADVLIVAKLDRLSRSILDFAGLMETAKSQGWSVVVLDLGVDMTSTNGELIANIMMALAQWERKLIGDRTKAGLKAIRARGTTLGRPSGIDEGTLRLIRMMRDSGHSWQGIANALVREKVPTAQGGTWHGATVRKLYLASRERSSSPTRPT
jgi:DNA invertase Pin-like site-specific DNA recombinase